MKTPEESIVNMTEIVLPQHTNALGSIFGGTVVGWIDVAAAIAASRHSNRVCVTASIDALHFLKPVKKGMVVNIKAQLTSVHKTSCEVFVEVFGENPIKNVTFKTAQAFLTFVAVDDSGKPVAMPQLKIESQESNHLHKGAENRRQQRQKLRSELKSTLS